VIAADICSMNWSAIQTRYPGNSFANLICFQAAYVAEYTAYAMRLDESKLIDVRSKIGPVTTSWTLGSILYDIGALKCEPTSGEMCSSGIKLMNSTWVLVTLGSVLMILTLFK
jgi:hypothetical protein